jgi:hypothetical protein
MNGSLSWSNRWIAASGSVSLGAWGGADLYPSERLGIPFFPGSKLDE